MSKGKRGLQWDMRRWTLQRITVLEGGTVEKATWSVRFFSRAEAQVEADNWTYKLQRHGANTKVVVIERLWQPAHLLRRAFKRWAWDDYHATYGPEYLREDVPNVHR